MTSPMLGARERSSSTGRKGMGRFASIGLITSLVCSAAGTASAQTDSAGARALFQEGRSLMEAERYEEACPKFEESLKLDNGIGTQFNLAHCWEKLGRTASAWALFLDVAAAAKADNQEKREAAARERAKALEPRLTRMRIDVSEGVPGMKIERDQTVVGKAAWGSAVPVDPGRHVIEVTAPGKKPWSDEVETPATARTFTVKVPALEDAPVDTPQPQVASAGAGDAPVEATLDQGPRGGGGMSGQAVTALVVGGVGLAAIATGTFFAIQSRSSNDSALALCHSPDPTSPTGEGCGSDEERDDHAQYQEDAKNERLYGFIGFGIGGAALVTSVILFVTDSGSSGSASSFEVAPLLGSGIQGASISGHF